MCFANQDPVLCLRWVFCCVGVCLQRAGHDGVGLAVDVNVTDVSDTPEHDAPSDRGKILSSWWHLVHRVLV